VLNPKFEDGRVNGTTARTQQADGTENRLKTPERILVVDNAKPVQKFISMVLTEAGYECRTCSSGREALTLLKSGERFDLLLCDLLNNPHGITLLERTKEDYPSMPVLIATAPCCVCTARFAVNGMGASGYLLKPFRAKTLLIAIWQALAGQPVADAPFGEE
jgi:DNA-binding NtrC family response regulator